MSRLTRREFLIASSAAALAGAGFPAFAATQTAGASRPRGGTLNVLINPEPPVLVSIFQTTGPALAVSSKVLEGLLAYDFDLSPKPLLHGPSVLTV
jgi:peptide/nickel transport system substrate-binding protein